MMGLPPSDEDPFFEGLSDEEYKVKQVSREFAILPSAVFCLNPANKAEMKSLWYKLTFLPDLLDI